MAAKVHQTSEITNIDTFFLSLSISFLPFQSSQSECDTVFPCSKIKIRCFLCVRVRVHVCACAIRISISLGFPLSEIPVPRFPEIPAPSGCCVSTVGLGNGVDQHGGGSWWRYLCVKADDPSPLLCLSPRPDDEREGQGGMVYPGSK